MPNVWTIHSGDVTGGPTKSNLHGCKISVNDDGTAYEFTKGGTVYAAASNNGTLPTVPFSFLSFGFAGYTWTINVTTLTGGNSGNQAGGSWTNDAPSIAGDEGGDWTAQAGSTTGDDTDSDADEGDADAASASA